jgi:predicted nucleic acid-binding protein
MQTWRVFLDANILFSASLRRGMIATLVDALRLRHELVSSELAAVEGRRNLLHKQPRALPALDRLLAGLRLLPESDHAPDLGLPSPDAQVLSSAIAAACTHFLTGDKKHFGPFFSQKIHGVLIFQPSALVLEKDLL